MPNGEGSYPEGQRYQDLKNMLWGAANQLSPETRQVIPMLSEWFALETANRERWAEARRAKKRKDDLRKQAAAKLSPDEIEALGL